MAKSLNLCQFIGNLGKDPEIAALPNGTTVAKFSLAVADDYKDKQGNKVERTNWVNIVAFGQLADIIARFVQKGSKIYIAGKFTTRSWEDQSGQKRYATEVVADNMQLLDGKQSDNSAPQSAPARQHQSQPAPPADEFPEDDIPF
jgi:single-strand DNA-binding protein